MARSENELGKHKLNPDLSTMCGILAKITMVKQLLLRLEKERISLLKKVYPQQFGETAREYTPVNAQTVTAEWLQVLKERIVNWVFANRTLKQFFDHAKEIYVPRSISRLVTMDTRICRTMKNIAREIQEVLILLPLRHAVSVNDLVQEGQA